MFGIGKIKSRIRKLESIVMSLCPHKEGFDFYNYGYMGSFNKKICKLCGSEFLYPLGHRGYKMILREKRDQEEKEACDKVREFGYRVSKIKKGD